MRAIDPFFILHVPGVPIPQGSKKAFRHSKTGNVVVLDDNEKLAAWRETVAFHARRAWAGRDPLSGPVVASMVFYLPRPAGHYGTGRNAGRLKESAPLWPAVKPDLDKLERAIFDSLEAAGIWRNDSVCCGVSAWKDYADDQEPGVLLSLSELDEVG